MHKYMLSQFPILETEMLQINAVLPALCLQDQGHRKIKDTNWLRNAFKIKILACLTTNICLWLAFSLYNKGEYS